MGMLVPQKLLMAIIEMMRTSYSRVEYLELGVPKDVNNRENTA